MKPFLITPETAWQELERLRRAIARVDDVLSRLAQQRAKYAAEVSEMKSILECGALHDAQC